MPPKLYKVHQNMSLGTIGMDQVRSFRKNSMRLRITNVCTSSARFAPSFVSQPNGPKCTKIVRNAPNMSLGSNGVEWVRSLRKILKRLRVTNFCTSSARFAPSFVTQPNGHKMHQNFIQTAPKHEFRVQWGGLGALVAKTSDATSWHELLNLFGPFCIEFRKATKQSRMHPNSTNAPNVSLGSNGMDRML